MPSTSRFECASSSLTLRGLLRKTRRVFWTCAAVGIAAHLSSTQFRGSQAEQKAAKPLTTQFVKRAPRLTKPLELKKRPQPKQRRVQRKMVAVRARMQHAEGGVRFQPVQVLGGLARPGVHVGRAAGFAGTELEPTSSAGAIEGTREAEQKIDMSLELLDIEALDTGKYHALVVQDPDDKRGISGFCRLGAIYAPEFNLNNPVERDCFEWLTEKGFRKLVRFINSVTEIQTDVLGRIALNDNVLFRAPWVVFNPTKPFRLTNTQRRNLGQYVLEGGFVFAAGRDCFRPPCGMEAAFRELKAELVESLEEWGVSCGVEKLPNSHPVYHCYFDFNGPPGGCDIIHHHEYPDMVDVAEYVEGIELEGRLLAMASGKEYFYGWACMGSNGLGTYQEWDPTQSLRFGVNTVILALTQEGSITHRLLDGIQ